MMPRKRWEAGTDPAEMLNFLQMKLTDRGAHPERGRKLVLYVVELCHQVWNELPWLCRLISEIAERRADGGKPALPVHPLRYYASGVRNFAWECVRNAHANSDYQLPLGELARWEPDFLRAGYEKPDGADATFRIPTAQRFYALTLLVEAVAYLKPSSYFPPPQFHSVPLLREIAGDPYRPVKFKPEWRTDTVMTLARQMYDSREFSAMPILADALQDAGCNVETMLNHCRDTSLTHVRGCWVVDLVLGKE
jgi:hypothetical protein